MSTRRQVEEVVIVDNKVVVLIISGLMIALLGWLAHGKMGLYGMIIGAFFTWVMATYAYVVYGVEMLKYWRVRILLIVPLTLYIVANILWYVYGSPSIEEILSQILGAISTTLITLAVLLVLLRIAEQMPGAKL